MIARGLRILSQRYALRLPAAILLTARCQMIRIAAATTVRHATVAIFQRGVSSTDRFQLPGTIATYPTGISGPVIWRLCVLQFLIGSADRRGRTTGRDAGRERGVL